jgi:hypothetical protein
MEYRALAETEIEYLRSLATCWQSYGYVAAGSGLVLGIVAGSMRGYVAGGAGRVSAAVAYGAAAVLFGGGALLCAVLLAVARRILKDVEQARVERVEGRAEAEPDAKFVRLTIGRQRFLMRREAWDRLGPPSPGDTLRVEFAALTRVVLTVDGRPAYG